MTKFKIDLRISSSMSFPFGLYFWHAGWLRGRWVEINYFEDREKARAFWEKIKDLPEYL